MDRTTLHSLIERLRAAEHGLGVTTAMRLSPDLRRAAKAEVEAAAHDLYRAIDALAESAPRVDDSSEFLSGVAHARRAAGLVTTWSAA